MTAHTATDQHPKELPFKPSWVNLLTAWIDRLPLPGFISYIILFLLSVVLLHLSSWVDGQLAFPELVLEAVISPAWGVIAFSIIHYLDNYSRRAMETFRESVKVEDEEFHQLTYQLSHMRPRWVWGITLFALIAALLTVIFDPSSLGSLSNTLVSTVVFVIISGISFTSPFLILYHTIRQLRWVNEIYKYVSDINIFWLDPLYGLAGLSMRTALIFILLLNVNYLQNAVLFGEEVSSASVLSYTVFNILGALLSFFLPLWGIHRKIETAKEDNLRDINGRIQRAMLELNELMDGQNREGIGDLRNGIQGLFTYRTEIENVTSWPWQPATLRGFLSTIFLPIIIWLIQTILGRFF